ncbi:a74a6bc8-682a-4163-a4f6-f7ed6ec6e020 [Thermothielavioides terrestris]|jgi:hypothetical protein
MPYI